MMWGHYPEAERQLRLAELGARGNAVRVMHTLGQHGVEVKRPWRGGRRGHGDQLSPRELDVTRLLVAGRTNREIARALFLSPGPSPATLTGRCAS
jgi:FixJ family two-component response regulator